MSLLSALRVVTDALLRRPQVERELDEELRSHLRRRANDLRRSGLSTAEAERQARVEFGSYERYKDECREAFGTRLLEELAADLRYGLRQLRRNAALAAVAIASIGLGIGANTAIFGVVQTVLLRALPYKDPAHLAILWTDNVAKDLHEELVSYPNYEDWSGQNRTFQGLAFCSVFTANVTGGGEPERVVAERVTPNLFPLLGVAPILGRTFTSADEQAGTRPIVLSYGFWQRQFGGSDDVLGKSLELDGAPAEVVGVMPSTLRSPEHFGDVQFWEPQSMAPGWNVLKHDRQRPSGYVVGRLKATEGWTDAQADMNTVARQLAHDHPDLVRNGDFVGFDINVVPLNLQVTGQKTRLELWLLFGAASVVLLIACTNVTTLLLSRSSSRAREFSLRVALGAGTARLVRQILTETVLLFLMGGALGVVFAAFGTRVLTRLGPAEIPRLNEASVNPGVLLFALGLSFLLGLSCGLVPALKASNPNVQDSLRNSSRSGLVGPSLRRAHGLLVVCQYALAVVLLTAAGLLMRSLLNVQAVSPGFSPDRVLMVRVVQSSAKPSSQREAFWIQALDRITSIPGVEAAGAVDNFFFSANADDTIVQFGRPGSASHRGAQVMDDGVSPDYFRTVAVPLIEGRFFSDADAPSSRRVAIVNQTFGRTFWPGEESVGQRFRFSWDEPAAPWITIVGVVGDMRREGLTKRPVPQVFLPWSQDPARGMDVVVRSASDPVRLVGAVRRAIWSVDRTTPVFNDTTLNDRLARQTAPRRFEAVLLGLFASIALALACIGIYGVLRYAVNERRQEIAVRMALGAGAGDVLAMVLRQGLGLAATGIAIGLIAALWLAQATSALLYDVTATDPLTFVVVPFLFSVVSLLACYIPARRAAAVKPMMTLR